MTTTITTQINRILLVELLHADTPAVTHPIDHVHFQRSRFRSRFRSRYRDLCDRAFTIDVLAVVGTVCV